MLLLSVLMLTSGIQYMFAAPGKAGYNLINHLSLGNIDYSSAVCVQQYASLNETRQFTCHQGSEGAYMDAVISTGVISESTEEIKLTQCRNVETDWVSFTNYRCSIDYFNNETFMADYMRLCYQKRNCYLNLASYMQASAGPMISECVSEPARVYL